jgi:translation initiation factor 4A
MFIIDQMAQKYESFDDMDLDEGLLRGIYSFGFEKPSEIQKVAIKPVISGGDVIGQAQSGTGKTGAFTIGILNRIKQDEKNVQAIVLLPTRELAVQVSSVVKGISSFMNVSNTVAVGGHSLREQIDSIKNGSQVLIGTPGRVYDLMSHRLGREYFSNIKMLVMDEADEMLSSGFQEQVREIFRFIPNDIQVCLFSATLNADVMRITDKFLRDPTNILVEAEQLTLDGIRQYYVNMREQDKFNVLMDLYETMSIGQCIIYCNSRGRVEEVAHALEKNNFTVGAIHGQMEWDERKSVMDDFRSGKTRVLLATDLLARGIDVQQVSIVINYDIPRDVANYLHRIGRSGRYGRKGIGINFVTSESTSYLSAIVDHYKTNIEELPVEFMKHLE